MAVLRFDDVEREQLCGLLEELGPDAPTLVSPWTAHDLAAHLACPAGWASQVRRTTTARTPRRRGSPSSLPPFGSDRRRDNPLYLQSTGFILAPDGTVLTAVYSSAAIGRLVMDDVLGFSRYTREHVA
jgi:hypothetical protein